MTSAPATLPALRAPVVTQSGHQDHLQAEEAVKRTASLPHGRLDQAFTSSLPTPKAKFPGQNRDFGARAGKEEISASSVSHMFWCTLCLLQLAGPALTFPFGQIRDKAVNSCSYTGLP